MSPVEWSLRVAGLVGMRPPMADHASWLRLHHDQAEACMTADEYGLLHQQMGWE